MVFIIKEIKIEIPVCLFTNKNISAIKKTNLPSPKKVMYLKNLSKKLLCKEFKIIEKLKFS